MKWETVGCLIYRIIAKVHHVLLCCYLRYNIKGDSKSLLIYDNPKVVCPDNLTVGEHCSLNEGSLLHCVGNVVLGNNVTVSAGAKIFSTQYDREEILEGVDEAVSTLERMISEERVEELLSTLTDLQRKVVHTHLFHGLSFTEAAKHLGMTRQNLTGIYNAAIYKIQKKHFRALCS